MLVLAGNLVLVKPFTSKKGKALNALSIVDTDKVYQVISEKAYPLGEVKIPVRVSVYQEAVSYYAE